MMSREPSEELVTEIRAAMRGLFRASDNLTAAVAERIGVNLTDMQCMEMLDRNGSMTAGQIADAIGLTSGAVTTLIDRLEAAGYVRRLHDTADRRRVVVGLTDDMHKMCDPLFAGILKASDDMLSRFSPDQLTFLRDFLCRGREITEEAARAVRGEAPD